MRLRDNLNWAGNVEELNAFLDETFEIGSKEDFKFIALIPYNISVKQRDILEEMNLPEEQKKIIKYGLGYDYSSEYKIFMSHFYHKLKKEEVSEDYLNNLKNIREGILFKMQGTPLKGSLKQFEDIEVLKLIWPEFKNYPEVEDNFRYSLENLKNSKETKAVYPFVKKEKQNLLFNLSRDFFEENDYPPYIEKKGILPLELRCSHNIKETLVHGCYYVCPVSEM